MWQSHWKWDASAASTRQRKLAAAVMNRRGSSARAHQVEKLVYIRKSWLMLYIILCVLLGLALLLQLLLQYASPEFDLLDSEGLDSEGPILSVCCMQHFLVEGYWKLFQATSLSAFGRMFAGRQSAPIGLGSISINVTRFILMFNGTGNTIKDKEAVMSFHICNLLIPFSETR